MYVKSKYDAQYKGIVLGTFDIQSNYPRYEGIGYIVLVVYDKNGKKLLDFVNILKLELI